MPSPLPCPPPPRRPSEPVRRALRVLAAIAFTGSLVGAAVMTASGSSVVTRRHSGFSHRYPPDRATVERPKVHGKAPLAGRAETLSHSVRVDSLAALAHRLPAGVLRRVSGGAWLLRKGVSVDHGAVLALRGGTLELGPGVFLQARAGGTVELRGMSVTGVDAAGRPLARPAADRAFLVGRDGGRLVLVGDRIRDLGHLGVVAYGIALRQPGAGTRVVRCTIDRDYFGVYLSHADGVVVAHNRISHSTVYGIDPYGHSRRISIVGNVVRASGLHGIVLADGVTGSRVVHNTIDGARGHGIVVYRGSDGNRILDNRIRGSFDGIVLTDASRNVLARNLVSPVVRFGLRLSGTSAANLVRRNRFGGALLGAYLYGGASANRLLDNVFSHDRENVRIRSDAPHNVVTPRPSRSEGVG